MGIPREIEQLLSRARESIEAARLLLEKEMTGFAISRAYYAMFYCAEALLLQKGLSFSKHGAVIAAFGKHFAQTNILDPKFHRSLREAFDQRLIGDYDVMSELSIDAAAATLESAQEFYEVTRKYFEQVR